MKQKIPFICLLSLLLCFTASCKQEPTPTEPAPGNVYMLNDFESVRELYSIRPAILKMSATVDIVDADNGQVKSGKSSMKFFFEKGNWPDLVLHVAQTPYPDLDIATLSKMNLSVYNGNETAVSCRLDLVGADKTDLDTKEFTLEPGIWNLLELPIDVQPGQQILGFRLHVDAEDNSLFYIDEWTVSKS